MPRLRNISPHELDVFAPAGEADTFPVEAGQEITVDGDLAAEQPADAYQIGEGDDARLWPHSVWELVQDTPPASVPEPAAALEAASVPEPSISVPLPAAGEEH